MPRRFSFLPPFILRMAISFTPGQFASWSSRIPEWTDKQLAFGAANGINSTLVEAQDAVRARMAQAFRLRRVDFAFRSVKINRDDFASKSRLAGYLRIQGPRADLFARFEDGGARPFAGAHIAVPESGVARTGAGIIQRSQRPRALLDTPASRAFLVKTASGAEFILQRFGPRAGRRGGRPAFGPHLAGHDANVRVLYDLVTHATLPPSLQFGATVRRVVADRLASNVQLGIATAFRTAR